jgi:hypothetical protein
MAAIQQPVIASAPQPAWVREPTVESVPQAAWVAVPRPATASAQEPAQWPAQEPDAVAVSEKRPELPMPTITTSMPPGVAPVAPPVVLMTPSVAVDSPSGSSGAGFDAPVQAVPVPASHVDDVRRRSALPEGDEDRTSSEAVSAAQPVLALDVVPPGVSPPSATALPPAPFVTRDATMPSPGPTGSQLDVASIVKQVTRTLALRDLEALDAGREVVLRLDESLLPQTVLSFKPMAVAASGAGAADGAPSSPEVLVSLETRSDEVRAFLNAHGQTLIEAMAREAPGMHWVRGAANSWLNGTAGMPSETALAQTAAASLDPGPTAAAVAPASVSTSTQQGSASRDQQPPASFQDERSGAGSQDRGSSSGSSSGQGSREGRAPAAPPPADDPSPARARAADRWAGLSEAARQQAAQSFEGAVDGRA